MEFVSYSFGIVISVFVFYQLVLAVFSIGAGRATPASGNRDISRSRIAVVIPAHNEEVLIADLVYSIKNADYPEDSVTTFVIADNCNDRTAELARDAGAECFERNDTVQKGKPYALDWLFRQMDHDSFDAYTIIDADTIVDAGYLKAMDRSIREGNLAIQGYFGVMNPDENWLTRLSVLPGVLRYIMQCPGKARLGLSCPLAGNGMCFSSEVIRKYGWNAYSIAENWEYYALLVLADIPVVHEPAAIIYSQVANSLEEGKAQRMRWMRGRIDTLKRYWWPLSKKTIRTGDPRYIDVVMELLRPSHAMLFLAVSGFLGLAIINVFLMQGSVVFMYWALVLMVLEVSFFLSGLFIQKAPLKTWLSLAWVPVYLVWKLLVSVKGLVLLGDKAWVKTKRN